MQILPDASAESLGAFVSAHVEPGAQVITDGWTGYRGLTALGSSQAADLYWSAQMNRPEACNRFGPRQDAPIGWSGDS